MQWTTIEIIKLEATLMFCPARARVCEISRSNQNVNDEGKKNSAS